MKNQSCFSLILLFLMLFACSSQTPAPQDTSTKSVDMETIESEGPAELAEPEIPIQEESGLSTHVSAQWTDLNGWLEEDLRPAWQAFSNSCVVLKKQPLWQKACATAALLQSSDNEGLRNFFEDHFTPYQVINRDGNEEGLVTGYYEPLLHGSRQSSARYRYPLYAVPDELLVIDLGTLYPELEGLRLRGRLDGRKVVPYYSRAEIMDDPAMLEGNELLWVDDQVELFFLQIQGSGRVKLDTGEVIKIGFADQNGYPYNSIGKILVKQGELPLEKASMQGIKQWGEQNPEKLQSLLQQNARYVFFRELPADLTGPIGALGVPLTAGRSVAVDPRSIPQGAPVFLSTTWPNTDKPLNRLMMAQDTGGAIKGGIRIDFFWGYGPEAGNQAGKMKQQGKVWVLMPQGHSVSQLDRQ